MCDRLIHAHYYRDELHTPVVPVPLHALERLEVGLVEAHVLGPGRLGAQTNHRGAILHSYGLLPLDAGRTRWERTAFLVVPKHASEAVGSLCPPAYYEYYYLDASLCRI